MKKDKKKKKKHRHRWDTDGDSCMCCGAYERYCKVKSCSVVQLMNREGKVIDEAI